MRRIVTRDRRLTVKALSLEAARADPSLLQHEAATAVAVIASPRTGEEVRALCAEMAEIVVAA